MRLEEVAYAAETLGDAAYGQHEVGEVLPVEGAVHIGPESCQFLGRGVAHEIGGRVVHVLHHAAGALYYGLAVAPRYGGGEESCYLAVLLGREGVGNADGIGFDEFGAVVFVVQVFEQIAQFLFLHYLSVRIVIFSM